MKHWKMNTLKVLQFCTEESLTFVRGTFVYIVFGT